MPSTRLVAVLGRVIALLTPMLLTRAAHADPATDIGVIPPGQGTPNQPPPFQGTPNQPPPFQGTPNQPPPYQPPPQQYQYQPQPQYQQPQYQQPQYQQQYRYQPQPQQQYQAPPPRRQPYHDGDPVPDGYHVEDKPRSGLVVGGWLMLLIPYGISALSAVAAKGDNETGWLYVPVAGPWFMMGRRNYADPGCGHKNNDASDGLGCVADVFVVTGLIVDGVLQAAGATMLLLAYLNPKQELVRDQRAVRVLPTRVGSGYGLGLGATF
jgi:hypothetical protein